MINTLSKIIEWGIILLAFLMPLFFLPITSEAFEFPKQLLLIFSVSFLTIIWAVKIVLEKSAKIIYSPLVLPAFIFFVFFFISAVFSIHRLSSIFGSYPRFSDGLVSLFIYLLFFFLVSFHTREKKQIIRILVSICLAGTVIAVLGILNYFDFYLFGNFLRNSLVTPAGFADRAVFFLAILLPALFLTFLFAKRKIFQALSVISGFLALFYICLISDLAAVLAVFLMLILFAVFYRFQLPKTAWIKTGIVFLIFLLLLIINDIGFVKSYIPLIKDRTSQHELKIDPNTAWTVAIGGFQNLKLLTLGSGPGTYLFDFTSFKPVRFNQTPLWNLRFERSFNEYFQIIPTLGVLAFFVFLWFLFVLLKLAKDIWKKVISERKEEKNLAFVLASSLLIFLLISLFTPSFTLIYFTFWLFLGLIVSLSYIINLAGTKETELSLATVQIRGVGERRGEIMPWLIAILVISILFPLLWKEINILQAELYFSRVQTEQLKEKPDPNMILGSLIKARNIMPDNDSYRRALSATALNFAILAEQQKTLTDESKQQLLQTAVVEGEMAVRLAPHNIFNWENLQRVYSTVTLENQDDLLMNNVFLQEISLDPTNPGHRNDLGLAYINLRNDTELAKINFQNAISLKPDFVDAHYSLAIIYRQEGKKEKAVQAYDQTLSFLTSQISFLEPVVSSRADLQSNLDQLKQLEAQIESERGALLLEIEEEQQPEISPEEAEIKKTEEETTPIETGE